MTSSGPDLIVWLNGLLKINYTSIEQCGSGGAYCQIMDSIYGDVPMTLVIMNAKHEHEFLINYKILQNSFKTHKVDKAIPVEKLVRCQTQDNLEFLQWMKRFWEANHTGRRYDAANRRNAPLQLSVGTSRSAGGPEARAPINASTSAQSGSSPEVIRQALTKFNPPPKPQPVTVPKLSKRDLATLLVKKHTPINRSRGLISTPVPSQSSSSKGKSASEQLQQITSKLKTMQRRPDTWQDQDGQQEEQRRIHKRNRDEGGLEEGSRRAMMTARRPTQTIVEPDRVAKKAYLGPDLTLMREDEDEMEDSDVEMDVPQPPLPRGRKRVRAKVALPLTTKSRAARKRATDTSSEASESSEDESSDGIVIVPSSDDESSDDEVEVVQVKKEDVDYLRPFGPAELIDLDPAPPITIQLPQITPQKAQSAPPSALVQEALEHISLATNRMQETQQLPFRLRNLRKGFLLRCKNLGIPTDPKENRRDVIVRLRYDIPGVAGAYETAMIGWRCPICSLHGCFPSRKVLRYHLEWDHSDNVEAGWTKGTDGIWAIHVILTALSIKLEEEGEVDQYLLGQNNGDNTLFPYVAISPPQSPERRTSLLRTAGGFRSVTLSSTSPVGGRDDSGTPIPSTPTPTPSALSDSQSGTRSTTASTSRLSITASTSTSTTRTTSATTPSTSRTSIATTSSRVTGTTATPGRRTTPIASGMLPGTAYPQPPPSHDPLGPAERPPYLPASSDYGGPDVVYSCRPGGPSLFDLLGTLPMDEFGILEWAVLDKEEEIYESDDVKDEHKVMHALWARWILLHRTKFISNYYKGVIAFIDQYWKMIHRAAGWEALRFWLLLLHTNRFLTPEDVAKCLKHYEAYTGMALWAPPYQ